MRIVYLHGFASSPQSNKSQYFCRRFGELGIRCEIPRLDRGNFRDLTVTGQMEVIDKAVRAETVTLMGSSMGGYLAALYASGHANVERLVLLAPAFQFSSRWRSRFSEAEFEEWRRTGERGFFHYAYKGERPLGYRFVEDAVQYVDEPDFAQPALILHGSRDEVVPVEVSEKFADTHKNVQLKVVPSGHELTDVLELLWDETARFLWPEAGDFQIR
jgi:uncharacterized protein